MTKPLVVIDADVLGRHRTGDETYVEQLLAALPEVADDLRFAAITRRPELLPPGVEPLHLPARSQELRMARAVPSLLRRTRPALAHFLHALPLRCPCPAVVTVQDLSWERDPTVMPLRTRMVFRIVVPRAARRAARVLTISERTKRDLVELYRIPDQKIVVTLLAVDPAFHPEGERDSYLLYVGAIEPRKQPLLALDAAEAVGRQLVVVGPTKDDQLAEEFARHRVRFRPSLHQRAGLAAEGGRHVDKRPQRPRRQQRLACPIQGRLSRVAPIAQRAHERRLPGAGLAPDERHHAGRARANALEALLELPEFRIALQQEASVAPHAGTLCQRGHVAADPRAEHNLQRSLGREAPYQS